MDLDGTTLGSDGGRGTELGETAQACANAARDLLDGGHTESGTTLSNARCQVATMI